LKNPHWDYFTAGVVVVGDIINKSVQGGLVQFADETLFAPLGITKYKWEYTPQKVGNTAGGLRLSSLDLAKIGELYRQNGKWNNTQIIPASWVEKSLSHQAILPDGNYYGYLFWNKIYVVNNQSYEVYYASGNGGNKIFIFKDYPIVIVITATAYNEGYAHIQIDNMMENYLIPALKLE
jgi:CubicO group peptidase (beta-lactamase class C family)